MPDTPPVLSSKRGRRLPSRDDGIVLWEFTVGENATLSVEAATCAEGRAKAKVWVDSAIDQVTSEAVVPVDERILGLLDKMDPETATLAEVLGAIKSAIAG